MKKEKEKILRRDEYIGKEIEQRRKYFRANRQTENKRTKSDANKKYCEHKQAHN